jgi:peptidoglycan/xylan/chitin deacetylase (PgdA/CDA1 family)
MPGRPLLAVHVDLDGVQQIFRAHGRSYGGTGDPIFASGMRHMLQTFADTGVRATLFVIAEDLRDADKLAALREAAALGHEVASHTITHANLLRLTSGEKAREIAQSKAMLEDTLGVAVEGFRAPGYAIDEEALRLIGAAGYTYDSSVFPTKMFAQRLQRSRESLRRPFRLADCDGLTELPLPGPMPLGSPIGPSFALAFGLPAFFWAMGRAARRGFPAVLLFHLIDFAAPLDAPQRGGAWMSLFTLSTRSVHAKRVACRRMIGFAQQRFTLASTSELVALAEPR